MSQKQVKLNGEEMAGEYGPEDYRDQTRTVDRSEGSPEVEATPDAEYRSEDEIKQEYEKVEDLVRSVLEQYEAARNSDMALIWFVGRKLQKLDLNDLQQFQCIVNPRTLIRKRAEIQNEAEELLPTDPAIIEQRSINEDAIRAYYADTRPDVLEDMASSEQ